MRTLETPLKLDEMQLTRLARCTNAVLELRCAVPRNASRSLRRSGQRLGSRTRRSTGGGLVFWGKRLLDSCCQQQLTISLSIAEADLHEIVNGAARGLFIRNVQAMEQKSVVRVGTDSNAEDNRSDWSTKFLDPDRTHRHMLTAALCSRLTTKSHHTLVRLPCSCTSHGIVLNASRNLERSVRFEKKFVMHI